MKKFSDVVLNCKAIQTQSGETRTRIETKSGKVLFCKNHVANPYINGAGDPVHWTEWEEGEQEEWMDEAVGEGGMHIVDQCQVTNPTALKVLMGLA